MPLYVHYCKSVSELEFLLQGAIVCGKELEFVDGHFGFYGLENLDLTFKKPSIVFTFDPGELVPGFVTYEEIKELVTNVAPELDVKLSERKLVFQSSPVGSSIELGSDTTEPSRAILGLSAKACRIKGVAYNAPGGALPRLITVSPGAGGTFVAITEEA